MCDGSLGWVCWLTLSECGAIVSHTEIGDQIGRSHPLPRPLPQVHTYTDIMHKICILCILSWCAFLLHSGFTRRALALMMINHGEMAFGGVTKSYRFTLSCPHHLYMHLLSLALDCHDESCGCFLYIQCTLYMLSQLISAWSKPRRKSTHCE